MLSKIFKALTKEIDKNWREKIYYDDALKTLNKNIKKLEQKVKRLEQRDRQRELEALLSNCVDDDEVILLQRELEGLEEVKVNV